MPSQLAEDHLVSLEVSIGAVRNHYLARLEMELAVVELHRYLIRLERHQV